MARSSSVSAVKRKEPLAGGFSIGDAVVYLRDSEQAEGKKIVRGDRGTVRGQCNYMVLEGALNCVNCDFPGWTNVNVPVTNLRKADEPLPGGFSIGDAVVYLQDSEQAEGKKIVRGDRGTVRCHCNNMALEGAKNMVNCHFPGWTNVNVSVASLRKADEPLPGGFSIGDAVVYLQDSEQAEGKKIVRGDRGAVCCHCNNMALEGAKNMVNCHFPDWTNVNVSVTSLRKADEPLPGGFSIGDAVVYDYEGSWGKLTRGDRGTVRCHCNSMALEDAKNRVNCAFPGLMNINVPVTFLRKAEPVATAAGSGVGRAGPGRELLRLSAASHPLEWNLLEDILRTDARLLGKGKDASTSYPYDRLKLVRAWRVQQSDHKTLYSAHMVTVRRQMEALRSKGLAGPATLPGLPVKTAEVAAKLCTLEEEASEVLLLHGTSQEKVISILRDGLNERYSGTEAGSAFGDGIYLAEDMGKADQYAKVDREYDSGLDLHRILYGKNYRHPGQICYALVCRAILGLPARTKESGRAAVNMDTGTQLFPVSFRELADVPGTASHPIKHHSLIVECAGTRRFREVVIFHGDRILVEFILGYQRLQGDKLAS